MSDFIVVVDNIKDWHPYFPTDQVVQVKDYLFGEKFQHAKNLRVLNLCKNIKYLSLGYYTSLLAESRQHKVMPTVKVLNDLSKKRYYLYDLEEVQNTAEKAAKNFSEHHNGEQNISFKLFFGETPEEEFKLLGKEIFTFYPFPILEVKMSFKKFWKIDSLTPISLKDLEDQEEDFFAEVLEKYNPRIWRTPTTRTLYRYDLAILVDPEEALPPSNAGALKKFSNACKNLGIFCEIITKKDINRLNEFDALFIRKTTSLNNITYLFAKKALEEGIVVIDDPDSILRCTNKIYLFNLFKRKGINSIPGTFISENTASIRRELEDSFAFPMVLKIPDGSFSIGISKVSNMDELKTSLDKLFEKTALVLVQKFFFTDFDWRIGLIGGKPLYACKYYMSKNHWQIYNHSVKASEDTFSGDSETLSIDEVPRYVLDTALKAANSIGTGLYGVDIKDDGQKAYVVEVNDNPNIDEGVEDEYLKDKLYEIIIQEFITRIDKKNNSLEKNQISTGGLNEIHRT